MKKLKRKELINKQYKAYDKLSRYSAFPYYYDVDAERYLYGTTTHLDKNITYTLHEVIQFDTWDSLASYYYNNPTYYWILCDFNDCNNPFQNPKIGTFIKIPAFSEIKFIK